MNVLVQQKSEAVVFQQPRLPYHDAINERFGIDRAGWKALTEAIFPNAKTTDSVIMALSYCRARKLDPFKRPVHIVPMWSSVTRSMVETVWPGIAELRTTAFRTGQYAGKDETEFGEIVTKTFKGSFKDETREVTVEFPSWGRTRMTRILAGKERVFVSPKVMWLETYAKWGNTTVPNDMWAKRPSGQLEKCVEAAGLRCAFPEEIGNDLTAEEMEGQRLIEDVVHSTRGDDGPPPPPARKAPARAQPTEAELVSEFEAGLDDGQQIVWSEQVSLDDGSEPQRATADDVFDGAQFLKDLEGAYAACEDMASLFEAHKTLVVPNLPNVFPPDRKRVKALWDEHYKRIEVQE